MVHIPRFNREDKGAQPPYLYPAYASSPLRSPALPPIPIPHTLTETTGPSGRWEELMGPAISDLTSQHRAAPIGQKIIVGGRVLDEDHRPVPHTIIEIWQANAAGRYVHRKDNGSAPLDPNFTGAGRVITNEAGKYRYVTIRPGAYPWGNHHNAWRPAHIHLSLLGPAFATRLITQMYFPNDPLIDFDPIANSVPLRYRQRLVAHFDMAAAVPTLGLGYRFDIVLRGRDATPMES